MKAIMESDCRERLFDDRMLSDGDRHSSLNGLILRSLISEHISLPSLSEQIAVS